MIFRSGLFDSAYYRRTYPDVGASQLHPLIHFLDEGGALQGRKPNLFFDPSFYSRMYPEIEREGSDPFQHYISQGWKEGRLPSHLFHPDYYLAQITESKRPKGNPLAHFLRIGLHHGIRPSPYFDPEYYRQNNPDVPAGSLDTYIHYLEIGALERRRPSLYFDTAWYQDKTSSLQEMRMDLIQHYIEYGCLEGKTPNPLFDPGYYCSGRGGIEKTGRDPFLHFLLAGVKSDRRPCRWFDPAFYRRYYAKDLPTAMSPCEHYLENGVYQGRYGNEDVASLPHKPVISIIVPVYNVNAHYLNNCIRSVLYQSYPHWELCLADDCSTNTHIRPILEQWAAQDNRIRVVYLAENRGIVAASNAAASNATGDFVGFLDNDDELEAECLYEIVKAINERDADLLYTDEDLIGDDGRQFSIFRKPDYNRELSLVHNYIVHFMVMQRRLFQEIKGFTEGMDGAQDYDLFLKASEKAGKIAHLPKILYHWRASVTSTSINHAQKTYAEEAGRRTLAQHLDRQKIDAVVQDTELKFFYRVKRIVSEKPTVSVVVSIDNDEDKREWAERFLKSASSQIVEILFLIDEGKENEMNSGSEMMPERIVLYTFPKQQPRSSRNNWAASQCRGEFLIFLQSDVVITSADWVETLLEYAACAGAGMVGGRIDGKEAETSRIRTLPDIRDLSAEYYARFFKEASSHMNGLQCPQNVLAVSWDLCMVKRDLFIANGGFSETNFPSYFGDADLCLRLRKRGYENTYTPYCKGVRQKLKWSDSIEREEEDREMARFKKTWRHLLKNGDPYYNIGILEDNGMERDEFFTWYAGS